MKGLFIAFVVLMAVVIGVGFYRGWWNFASDSTDTKVHLNVTVDKNKIHEDKETALKKVQDLGHDVKTEATVPTEKSEDEVVPPVQPPQY